MRSEARATTFERLPRASHRSPCEPARDRCHVARAVEAVFVTSGMHSAPRLRPAAEPVGKIAAGGGFPSGWKSVGQTGTRQECLDYIKEVWTDMRPLSLRKKLDGR